MSMFTPCNRDLYIIEEEAFTDIPDTDRKNLTSQLGISACDLLDVSQDNSHFNAKLDILYNTIYIDDPERDDED